MKLLARVGIVVAITIAGCSTSHGASGDVVRSCTDARLDLVGSPCVGFGDCPFYVCPHYFTCRRGTLRVDGSSAQCDAGPPSDSATTDSSTHDASHDAGVDAGPCAPHQPATGTGCHASGDCNPARFEMCYAPGASPGCGPCVRATRTCATGDCAATDYCLSYVDPCTHPGLCGTGSDPTSTRCVPRCTATSCANGETCSANGRCNPIPCINGYACPAHTHCTDVAGGDRHGCARDACAFDADCGCGGACLMGFCYDTLGTCMPPAA